MMPAETIILSASSTVHPQSNAWDGLIIKIIPVNGCGTAGTNTFNNSSTFWSYMIPVTKPNIHPLPLKSINQNGFLKSLPFEGQSWKGCLISVCLPHI